MFKGTPNTNGRPKGAKGKITTEIKELIANILQENQEDVKERFRNLPDADFIKTYIQLMRFIVPTPKQVTIETESREPEEVEIVVLNGKGEEMNKYKSQIPVINRG
jgi:hypothetical protein